MGTTVHPEHLSSVTRNIKFSTSFYKKKLDYASKFDKIIFILIVSALQTVTVWETLSSSTTWPNITGLFMSPVSPVFQTEVTVSI